MHILVGLGLAVVLLYFWLIGHWFARVLMFLLLGAVFGLFGLVLLNAVPPPNAGAPQLDGLGAIGGVIMAWFVAGIPTYYRRWRIKELEAEDERRLAQTLPPSLRSPAPVKRGYPWAGGR